jgi:hypothetical protein
MTEEKITPEENPEETPAAPAEKAAPKKAEEAAPEKAEESAPEQSEEAAPEEEPEEEGKKKKIRHLSLEEVEKKLRQARIKMGGEASVYIRHLKARKQELEGNGDSGIENSKQ